MNIGMLFTRVSTRKLKELRAVVKTNLEWRKKYLAGTAGTLPLLGFNYSGGAWAAVADREMFLRTRAWVTKTETPELRAQNELAELRSVDRAAYECHMLRKELGLAI